MMILTHTVPQIPGRQNFDRQVRVDLSNDLDRISIGEMRILECLLAFHVEVTLLPGD